ncbi:hypothetical protein WAX87_15785 [Photobacterium damselae subsp. damselae]|uniref:hypothetical protein n=1 Tax=Photobacterium damselae TaxID=38293 RepID=UPI00311B14BE
MIILLDLNYTLVANSEVKTQPFSEQIDNELYRQDLLDAINGHTVILITARPEKYRVQTLMSIFDKTGWVPDDAYFNQGSTPPKSKYFNLTEYIFPQYGVGADYLAIESNPRTRKMYQQVGIKAVTYKEFMNGHTNELDVQKPTGC